MTYIQPDSPLMKKKMMLWPVYILLTLPLVHGFAVRGSIRSPAVVADVAVTGKDGDYSFSVTLRSPDTGCGQYADWWEVIDPAGKLLYRRILRHSHVDEQPFTRSGGPVPVRGDTEVIVRVHMNDAGYSRHAMKGNIKAGFTKVMLPDGFAKSTEKEGPLPAGCDF